MAQHCIIGVQSCGNDYAAHYRKITEEHRQISMDWLACGGRLELWSWRMLKVERGKKRMTWQPRIKRFALDDFKTEAADDRLQTAM